MNIFTKHPYSVEETYLEHMKFAMKFSGKLFLAAGCCFIHALFPFIFQNIGSNLIAKMAAKLSLNKRHNIFDEQLKKYIQALSKSE